MEDQILDRPMVGDEDASKHVYKNLASNGLRFANMLIDQIAIYVLIIVFGAFVEVVASDLSEEYAAFLGLMTIFLPIGYYWAFESLTGKTLAKFVTRTRIVKLDGSHPTAINVLGRTLSRYIPFDAFSFLGQEGKGWHDSVPKIYVIRES